MYKSPRNVGERNLVLAQCDRMTDRKAILYMYNSTVLVSLFRQSAFPSTTFPQASTMFRPSTLCTYDPMHGRTRRGRPRTNYINYIRKVTVAKPRRLASACGRVSTAAWLDRERVYVYECVYADVTKQLCFVKQSRWKSGWRSCGRCLVMTSRCALREIKSTWTRSDTSPLTKQKRTFFKRPWTCSNGCRSPLSLFIIFYAHQYKAAGMKRYDSDGVSVVSLYIFVVISFCLNSTSDKNTFMLW